MTLQPLSELDQAFERSFPTPDAARSIYEEQEFHRAVEAYRFFYPTVSLEALFDGLRDAHSEDGALFLLAAGPRHGALTASSDTPYAIGVLDLERLGPLVVEMPPGMFLGVIDDHHQRWILDLGLTGPDAGEGGKYLVLPPGHAENVRATRAQKRIPEPEVGRELGIVPRVTAHVVSPNVPGGIVGVHHVPVIPEAVPSAFFDLLQVIRDL